MIHKYDEENKIVSPESSNKIKNECIQRAFALMEQDLGSHHTFVSIHTQNNSYLTFVTQYINIDFAWEEILFLFAKECYCGDIDSRRGTLLFPFPPFSCLYYFPYPYCVMI